MSVSYSKIEFDGYSSDGKAETIKHVIGHPGISELWDCIALKATQLEVEHDFHVTAVRIVGRV